MRGDWASWKPLRDGRVVPTTGEVAGDPSKLLLTITKVTRDYHSEGRNRCWTAFCVLGHKDCRQTGRTNSPYPIKCRAVNSQKASRLLYR
jgi:hypothetical protein